MEKREGVIEDGKQKIEGRIENIESFREGGWEQVLPKDIKLDDVDVFVRNENGKDVWYWHLVSNLIKDEKLREAWEREREIWP
jgi:hypothetical protein